MTPEERLRLVRVETEAREAREVLDLPAFTSILDSLTADDLRTIRNSAPEDQAKREDAYHSLRAIDRLRTELQRRVRDAETMRKRFQTRD